MIDLSLDRESLLRSLGAEPGCDVERLEVRGHVREDILPTLRQALVRRFPWIPQEQLYHDLLIPVRRGLGNAFKRGNRGDRRRWIEAELVTTKRGALVVIRNEGEGFDPAEVLARYRGQTRYFDHGGAGFASFQKSFSRVSYADRGRTMLICYACPEEGEDDPALAAARDGSRMREILQAELPQLRGGRAHLESLVIEPAPWRRPGAGEELLYRLGIRSADAATREQRFLARVLPSRTARTDYAVARALAHGPLREGDGVRAAAPVAAFKDQPRVVLHPWIPRGDFASWLRRCRGEPERLEAVAAVGRGLSRWHGCAFRPRERELAAEARERIAGLREDLHSELLEVAASAIAPLRAVCGELEARTPELSDGVTRPAHGALAWSRILHDGASLYFFEFEHARAAHPARDLGSFLAELRMHDREGTSADARVRARETFLGGYGRAPAEVLAALGWFEAVAVLEVLRGHFAGGTAPSQLLIDLHLSSARAALAGEREAEPPEASRERRREV